MDATQLERWRPVAGYEGLYEVSDQGRVRGVERELISANGQVRRWRARILAHDFDRHGYPRIGLHVGGRTKRFLVHHLVLHAFVGSKPDGMEVRHLNDVRSDNRLANLVYGTRSQNMFDAIRNGSHNRASRDRCCRGHLFDSETTRIRVNKKNGRTFRYCMICDRIRRRKD